MSYKHLDQIQNLYESVCEIDDDNNQLVKDAVTVISTSMYVEGYSTTAIKSYFDCADDVDILEKYDIYSKDFAFVDEETLTEDVDSYFLLEEESIDELNLLIEDVCLNEKVAGILRNVKKFATPVLRGIERGGRKTIKALKSAAGPQLKKVATKVKETGKKILGPEGTKKVKEIASKAKEIGGKAVTKAKETYKKLPQPAKNVLKFGTGLGGGIAITKLALSKKENKKPETKSTPTPDTKKPETDTKKTPDFSSIGDSIKASQTDAGKEIIKSVTTPKEKPAPSTPSKPSTASGKETPKPRAIGKGKGEINPNSARGRMIAKNQERFGKDRIQKLRDKNAAFQAARKKGTGYSMDDFVKDFPDSNTAKDRAKRKKIPSVMDYESYDAFDIVSNYLIDSNQVENMDEALYVMTEMDAQTIQGIVEDFQKQFQ